MTDRHNAFIVVLEKDMRDDDAVAVADAIRQLKGVLSVVANVADVSAAVAQERVRRELSKKLFDVLGVG